MRLLKQSTNVEIVVGPLVDKTDGITPETSLTIGDITAAKIVNGTRSTITLAASGDNEFTHLGDGHWKLDLTTTDTANLGQLRITLTDTSEMMPHWEDFTVVTANVYDSLCSTDKFDASVVQWLGTAVTAATAGVPNVNVTEIAGDSDDASDLGAAIDNTNNVVQCDTVRISGGTTAADNVQTAYASLIGSRVSVDIGSVHGDSDAAQRLEYLMDAAEWHQVGNGTTPTTTACELGSGGSPSSTDDQYNGRYIVFASGDNQGVVTQITDYVGSTNVATYTAVPTAPTAGDIIIFLV